VKENALLVQENVFLEEQCEILLNVTNAKAKGENIGLNIELPIKECLTFIEVLANQRVTKIERNEDTLKEQQAILVEENQCTFQELKL